MKRLKKEDGELLREILVITAKNALKGIKKQDYEDKKELISQIKTFKKLYNKAAKEKKPKLKKIINNLLEELEEVNSLIKSTEELLKG